MFDSDSPVPLQVNHRQAEHPIVVVEMIDKVFAEDAEWVTYLRNLAEYIAQGGHRRRLLPAGNGAWRIG